ncbi:hypothetical protein JCM3775_003270 [Rhodotorula graminis]
MPGQRSASSEHLASLDALLATLSRTRSSLPALLTAVSTSHSAAPHDRTAIYRAASTECSNAITALAHHLDSLEAVLQDAEDSARRDPAGIVLRSKHDPAAPQPQPRPGPTAQPEHDDNNKPWAALGDILHGGVATTTTTRKGKARAPYVPQLDPPTSPDELVALARAFEAQHPRVRVRVGDGGKGRSTRRPRTLEVVVAGVMRAVVGLRWEEREGTTVCEADWVMCHGLAEEKPPFLPSQFSLFQSITNDATEVIDQARVRRVAGESAASVEEVLAFLSDPPLPF